MLGKVLPSVWASLEHLGGHWAMLGGHWAILGGH